MPHKDPAARRAMQRQALALKRAKQRAEWKAPAPFLNVTRSHRYRREEMQRKAILAAAKQQEPPPITLPVVRMLTLEEIEAKYGRIE